MSALKLANKIRKFLDLGDIYEAERLSNNALPKYKEEPDLLFQIGYMHYARKRYSEAVELFRKVLKVRPKDADARLMLWGAYRDVGDFDQMLTLAHEFVRHPLSANELFLAYRSFLAVCDWEQAEKIQNKVMESLQQGKVSQNLA